MPDKKRFYRTLFASSAVLLFSIIHAPLAYAHCGKILQSVSGNNQEGFICEQIQQPLTVSVINGKNNTPQSGIGISWEITNQPTGAGVSVTPTSSATDSGGLASTILKLGSLPGDYTVNATCGECTSGSPQTFTATAKCPDVPPYYQDDYPDDSYDDICKNGANSVQCSEEYPDTWSIKEKGCALTSMAMIMSRYGWSFKPNGLNSAITSDINGYTEDGNIKWRVPDVTTGMQIKYIDNSAYNGYLKKVKGKVQAKTVQKSLMDDYLKKCMPVIVQVINPHTNSLHWILVTGISSSDYTVNDPDSANKGLGLLSKYGDIYNIRAYENQNGGCQ